jgi:hypothetical protein
MPNRPISIPLDQSLLAQLDAQGSNRSALVIAALTDWLPIDASTPSMPLTPIWRPWTTATLE